MAKTSLGQAYVQIVPSAKGIADGIEGVLAKPSTDAGKSGGSRFASAFKKLVAAAGIGTAISKAITAGAELEQSLGGVEVLYEKSADKVIANATRAWKTAGISANQYMEQSTSYAAALLSSLDGDTSKAADAADQAIKDMSDNANRFGTDLTSIQNAYAGFAKGNYTMLDNLKLGFGGTKTEMQRLLEEAGKISGQKYDISNLSDVYEAIHVMQTELGVTGTTAKEAETTISGSFSALKSSAENLLGVIALGKDAPQQLSESIANVFEALGTFVGGNLLPMVMNIAKSIPEALKSIVPQLTESGISMITNLSSGIQASAPVMIEKMLTAIDSAVQWVVENGSKLIDAGLTLITNLAKGIIDGIPVMIKKLPVIIDNIANFINSNAPKILLTGVSIVLYLIKGIIKSIPTLIQNLPQIAKTIFDVWQAVNWVKLGKTIVTGLQNGLKNIVGVVKAKFTAVKNAVSSAVKNIGSILSSPFKAGFNAIKNVISSILNKAKSFKNALAKIVPKLALSIPKIVLSAGKAPWGIGGKGSLPKFSVSWHKEGFLTNGATLIGAGEAGQEGLIPLDPFWKRMDSTLKTMESTGGDTWNITMNVDGANNPEQYARQFISELQRLKRMEAVHG